MLKILFIIIILASVFFLRRALIPVAIGITIAFVLSPFVDWIEQKLVRENRRSGGLRLLCVLLAYAIVLTAMAFLIWGFADIIAGKLASGTLQEAVASLKVYYNQYKGELNGLLGFSLSRFDMSSFIVAVGSSTINIVIGMVAGIYMLTDKQFFIRLGNQSMHLLLPQKVHGVLRELLFEINDVISAFLRGVLVDSVIVAFLSSLALTIIGIDFAVFIGCFAGIANVIPYFGPVIGIIPAVIAAMTSGGGLSKAIAAAIALIAVQQVEANFIYPRIIGKSTGLHPLFVLISVSIGGYFGGLLWMILAVPAAGIIKVIICKWAEEQ